MQVLPDRRPLSAVEKDSLIDDSWALVATLRATMAELQGRLAKNSRNFGKPPSSEELKKTQVHVVGYSR